MEMTFTPLVSIRLFPEAAIEEGIELAAEAFERFGLEGKGDVIRALLFDADSDEGGPIVAEQRAKLEAGGKDEIFVCHWKASFSLVCGNSNVTEAEALQQGLGVGIHRDLRGGDK
jgi:hypothetical protein